MTKILIVDDDQMIRRNFGRILREEGYQVDVFADGQSAMMVSQLLN